MILQNFLFHSPSPGLQCDYTKLYINMQRFLCKFEIAISILILRWITLFQIESINAELIFYSWMWVMNIELLALHVSWLVCHSLSYYLLNRW